MGKRSTIRLLGVLTGAVVAVTFLATVTGVSYLLVGPQFFHGPLKGNDEAHALTYVTWIARHLPDVPKWFPLQGGGISFVDGYPIGAHIVVVLLHNISQMSLNTALRLVEFASIPFTAFGVYVFTLHMLKRRSLAVLAGLFYPLSAISWNWITRGGFLAQGLSIAFVPWTLLFLDLYTESGGEGSPKAHRLRRRLHLLGALFSFSAAMLTHFITGVVLLGVAPLLAACRFLLERGNDPMHLALA
ncbi:MAG: hypothetical protein GTO63_13190, partial [Anaerolineae bacterium]|nr:hypothetical protein [Anaerolineae bacterium]NIN95798.1 hypothetical protein [Anaerolineae bacterium]